MSNEIKKSIDDIEIPEGAEERMYANILKKASAQKKPDIKMYRGICLAAACAAVVIVSAAVIKNNSDNGIGSESVTASENVTSSEVALTENEPSFGGGLEGGMMGGNPFAEEYTLDDITAAGFDVTLPENAEVDTCIIWDDSSAEVRFTLNGHLYYYSISEADGDFSGVYGSVAESSDISENAVLDVTDEGYFKAHWSGEKYNYYLCSTDGADRDEVIKTALFMAEQAE